MTRVLVVTNMYPTPSYPHLGIFVHDHVRALQDIGVDVDVLSVRPGSRKSEYVTSMRPLTERLRRRDYDVLHAQHSYCVAQIRVVRRAVPRGVPLVFTCHEGESYAPPEETRREGGLKRLTYLKGLKRSAMEYADTVVSVEAGLPALLGYRGAFETIAPGIDTERFKPQDPAEARRELGLPPDLDLVLFPADPRRYFAKGYDLFEAAMRNLDRDVRVVTGGKIDPSEMPAYVNAATVLVQTSRFEASPMILKEAMACSKPIVSSRVGDAEAVLGTLPGHHLCELEPSSVAAALAAALDGPRATGGRERVLELGLDLPGTAAKYRRVYEWAAAARAAKVGA